MIIEILLCVASILTPEWFLANWKKTKKEHKRKNDVMEPHYSKHLYR